jgi:PAS domain S-box-containing protein
MLPASEQARLEALRSYDVLDTHPEETFDRVTRLAAGLFSVPVASVSLVDADRVWFKSRFGFDTCEIRRQDAFCNHAVNTTDIFLVADARADPRFRDFPTVKNAPGIRFYAGAPLVNADGHILGTLCLLDVQPRRFSSADLEWLRDLALLVVDQLEFRRNAARLVQSAADYRGLFFNSPAGIYRTLPSGEILMANPAILKMLGYDSVEELQQHNLKHEELVGNRDSWCQALESKGEIIGLETTWKDRAGQDIAVRESTRLVRTPAGEVLWYEGWAEDISRRKAAEDERRQARDLIHEIFSTVVDLLCVYDLGLDSIVFANRELSTLLGYKKGEVELFCRRSDAYVHPDDLPQLLAYLDACRHAGDGKPIEIEFRMRHAGGEWKWLHSRNNVFQRGPGGDVTRLMGLTTDITERRRMQHLLHRQEERWQMAMAANNDGLWDWEAVTGQVYHSARWKEMLGYDPAEAVDWETMLHPEDAPRVLASLNRYIAREAGSYEEEYRIRAKDGSYRWVLARGIAQWDSSGKPIRMVGSHADITHRRQAETVVRLQNEALANAREKAEAAAVAKSNFLATMSHEIRTPLNGIIGMTGILGDSPLSAEQQDYLQTIRLSGEALLSVVNDILDFSKIEAGRLELEREDFDLWAALEETAALMAPAAHAKGLEITTPIDSGVPRITRGDSSRLRQILLNLLSNAVKFTEKGEIVVKARKAAPAGGASPLIRFEVIDTGVGIPQKAREQIFEAFTQADSSTTRRFGGTGLGLAISRQLATLMGGEIGVISEPGVGSTFWFTASLEPSGAVIAPPESSVDLRGKRVLIVDDNGTNRVLLEQLLHRVGMVTASAPGGIEALRVLLELDKDEHPVDLALLDLNMPLMDGIMLTRSIRSQAQFENLPIILLTSSMGGDKARAAAEARIHSTVLKPIRRDTLLAAMAAALGSPVRHPLAPAPRPVVEIRGHAKILVAEDNPVNQKVCGLILKKKGYTFETANNGREALDLVRGGGFDAVLLDCQMPEMDGFQAAREIRAGERNGARIPIIALTAGAIKGERERCLDAGMDDYISKPVQPDVLVACLEKWIVR